MIAGLLWMALDLPPDVSRPELESFAHKLVAHIRFGSGAPAIESEIAFLQCEQLGRRANRDAIRELAIRIVATVKG